MGNVRAEGDSWKPDFPTVVPTFHPHTALALTLALVLALALAVILTVTLALALALVYLHVRCGLAVHQRGKLVEGGHLGSGSGCRCRLG